MFGFCVPGCVACREGLALAQRSVFIEAWRRYGRILAGESPETVWGWR